MCLTDDSNKSNLRMQDVRSKFLKFSSMQDFYCCTNALRLHLQVQPARARPDYSILSRFKWPVQQFSFGLAMYLSNPCGIVLQLYVKLRSNDPTSHPTFNATFTGAPTLVVKRSNSSPNIQRNIYRCPNISGQTIQHFTQHSTQHLQVPHH